MRPRRRPPAISNNFATPAPRPPPLRRSWRCGRAARRVAGHNVNIGAEGLGVEELWAADGRWRGAGRRPVPAAPGPLCAGPLCADLDVVAALRGVSRAITSRSAWRGSAWRSCGGRLTGGGAASRPAYIEIGEVRGQARW